MTEIKETIAIFKIRWPEATLIVGFYTLVSLSNSLFRATKPDLTKTLFLLYIPFLLILTVVSTMLNYGFLRTVYLEGQKRQMPIDLLKIGKHFFWRMVGLGLIFVVSYLILTQLIFLIIKYFTSTDTGFAESAKSTSWLYQLCFVAAMLILIKVSLFIPALILVLDCGVFKSFKFLRKCKLLESKELVALFCLGVVIPLLWTLLIIPYNPETSLQYILRIVTTVISYALWLIIGVIAVRFVSSLDLVYDGSAKDLNSEDLVQPPTED